MGATSRKDYNITSKVNRVAHIKPYEVRINLEITNEKILTVLKSIVELPEHERFALVYWEISAPILPITQYNFKVEKLSQTVLHPGKWCTGHAEILYLLENEIKINAINEKQAKRIEAGVKYTLEDFLKKIEKKHDCSIT
jgi:hypothetical protein